MISKESLEMKSLKRQLSKHGEKTIMKTGTKKIEDNKTISMKTLKLYPDIVKQIILILRELSDHMTEIMMVM
jgi:hypothetical protein